MGALVVQQEKLNPTAASCPWLFRPFGA